MQEVLDGQVHGRGDMPPLGLGLRVALGPVIWDCRGRASLAAGGKWGIGF